MIIGSISENKDLEKRISLVPDIVKKYKNLGFDVNIVRGYGDHLGFSDDTFEKAGAKILSSKEEVIKNSNILIQLDLINENDFSFLNKEKILIGSLNYLQNKEKLEKIKSNGVNIFSLELLPRITRAQSMDILSSQANLAGYKAVIESFANFEKAIPMMMTAAGTIPAAKVLVVGAGVAGLQAIATAKRMGAIVFATDVRSASKEQSLRTNARQSRR